MAAAAARRMCLQYIKGISGIYHNPVKSLFIQHTMGPDIYTYPGLYHLGYVPWVGALGAYPGHLPKVGTYPGYPTLGRFQPTQGRC